MTWSSTSANSTVSHGDLPGQRTSGGPTPEARAATVLVLVDEATAVLAEVVNGFREGDWAAPSLLPGWTRGHVVSHLARNADALVNLLTWARTGIEHPAYPSRADRDADIDAGARRMGQIQREDLLAAGDRFHAESTRMSDADWAARIVHPSGRPMSAAEIPEARLFEVWTHLVDLDAGRDFGAVIPAHLDHLLDTALRGALARTDGEPLRLLVELPDGRQRTWEPAIATHSSSRELSGPAAAVLAWLTGRGDASGITGTPPELGAWG